MYDVDRNFLEGVAASHCVGSSNFLWRKRYFMLGKYTECSWLVGLGTPLCLYSGKVPEKET